jgi:hypothetical protein
MHLYYSKFNNDRQYDRQSSNFFLIILDDSS